MEEVLPIALFILQEAIKNEPAIESAIRGLFGKAEITAADWQALRAQIATKSYANYVPDSALTLPLPASVAQEAVAEALKPAAAPVPALTPATPAPAVFTGQAVDPHA